VRRAEWGADERFRHGRVQYDSRFEKVIIHHTATPNGASNWAEQVREIYGFETWHGYQDLAYHYLVDPNGVIYEGRWAHHFHAGETPNAANGRGQPVHGAHAIGHNNRTLGIALLGNYMSAQVTSAAAHSLAALLAWQCGRWGIDPRGSGVYVDDGGLPEWLENVCPHGRTTNTLCPGIHVVAALPAIRESAAVLMGGVPARPHPVAAVAPPPHHHSPRGYWIVGPDGRNVAFDGAPAVKHNARLRAPLAGVAASANGKGFWAFAADGGVFTFGDTAFHGSATRKHLRAPIVGMDSSASGRGYWLVARDGGVFAFGDARYHGSVAHSQLTSPIVAISRTWAGDGYVLLGADGGVFAFGDAIYHGSLAHTRLLAPAVDIVTVHGGYYIATLDGGVFAFGDAQYHGNARGHLGGAGVVGITATPTGSEYILLTNNGHTHNTVRFHGTSASSPASPRRLALRPRITRCIFSDACPLHVGRDAGRRVRGVRHHNARARAHNPSPDDHNFEGCPIVGARGRSPVRVPRPRHVG
jgi:hypothetical protein